MTLPASVRVPFFSVKMDPSQASQGPGLLQYRVLLIGGRTSAGTVSELILKKMSSAAEAEARTWFGEGSQLHLMVRAYRANNRTVPLYCMALDDAGTGVAATKTLTVTGPATADGTLVLYIGGKRIPMVVSSGDAQNAIAAALKAAIDLIPDLPMTATVSTNVVTLTARNDGVEGNDIDVRFNYGEGELFPAGVDVVVASGAAGANNADLADAIAALGDEWFPVIAAPYGDATNLTAIEDELADRFDDVRQIPGQYIFAKNSANLAAIETFGKTRNSPHTRCIDFAGIPWTPFEMAAAWAALEAASAQANPAKPQFRQTLRGMGAKQPILAAQRTFEEQNNLLHAGVSTVGYGAGGTIQIGRAITMYRKNEANADDTAYLRAETMYSSIFTRWDFRNQFLQDFPRANLADDGAFIPPGESFITPKIAKAKAVAIARGWEKLGIVENVDQLAEDMVVERPDTDPDRLNFLVHPDFVNQFVFGSALFQFKV